MKQNLKLSSKLFIEHGKAIEEVLRRAVRAALLEHKRAGNPIYAWKDGRVVMIPPEEILTDDPTEDKA